jgi:2,3-dimethylmalate lyase
MSKEKRALLAQRIRKQELVIAPGIFDMISAKIADRLGFECLYVTGYGAVASHLGLPDAGLATYTDMVGRVSQMVKLTRTPIIADADTGYGGLLNVRHTVEGYEAAGACALQLEDQEFPKKCGHMLGRRVIPAEEMAAKVRVAAESRSDRDFLVIARTDARTTLGLDEALRRAELYLKAGADVLFIESACRWSPTWWREAGHPCSAGASWRSSAAALRSSRRSAFSPPAPRSSARTWISRPQARAPASRSSSTTSRSSAR